MDTHRLNLEPQILSPSPSGRRSNSPEFEFWMVRNPSCPQGNLLSADELIVDGVLLPLQLLPFHNNTGDPPPDQSPEPESEIPNTEPNVSDPDSELGLGPELTSAVTESATGVSASKRWKDIFKKSDKKNAANNNTQEEEKEKDKEKKKERKSGSGASSAELNINIWPFSRSRSAGNEVTRPKLFSGAPGTRKVNSAPCSRSNSAGESKSKKWPSSPGRPGVHLARGSPVLQVRRGGSGSKNSDHLVKNAEKGFKREAPDTRRRKAGSSTLVGNGSSKARVLNLNVPMCINYRHHLGCKSDAKSAIGVSGSSDGKGRSCNSRDNGGEGGLGNVGSGGGNLFNLRSLFTKKSVLTSH
ncbi:putative Serine/arginine repetitive matrix protein 2 [Quillaja saponaria]|uniref:Serine/arginine repetitive matrix protein 2 n=1 Tax=Quillaja saponaria TaxID=32244 RepID=A0AAD7M0L8_QUISA|nr:putative Serine/arginine repetitive matrix protein 2 [Quillaja saponaria]